MIEENIVFGKRIRALREEQRLSREKLAEIANISTQFLADIETGKKGMSVLTLKKICLALHISSDYIIFERNNTDVSKIEAIFASVPKEKRENFERVIQMMISLYD